MMIIIFISYVIVSLIIVFILTKECDKKALENMNLRADTVVLRKKLEDEEKLNFEIKARFVRCNTCTSEMKDKCLMWSENLCEGERCNELIDVQALMNKDDLIIH